MSESVTPFFATGTARGGTGILVQTLGTHSQVECALDPFIRIYQSLRNDLVDSNLGNLTEHSFFDSTSPLDDYYFSDWKSRILDTVLDANLSEVIPNIELKKFVESMKPRTLLDSGDLVPFMENLGGETYKDLVQSAINVVKEARGSSATKWVGIHENWTIEMFPALAKTFKESKFIICLRDPRAVMASHLNAPPDLHAHILSYIRGMRKLFNLTSYFLKLPIFRDRLFVVTYEHIMRHPKFTAEKLCRFFNVRFESQMIDPDKHFDRSTGGEWSGLSSFEKKVSGYNPARIDRWRMHLDPRILELMEVCLDPDMRHFGYMPTEDRLNSVVSDVPFKVLVEDNDGDKVWRTDTGIPEMEYDLEMARREVIRLENELSDHQIIRQYFLKEEVYRSILDEMPVYEGDIGAKGGIWNV